jgi:hypothetical protein
MTFRRPLLAVPITLCALLVLLVASTPARASGPVTLTITPTGAQGEVECSVNGGAFEECEGEEDFEEGSEIVLRGHPAPTVAFVGFGNGTGSAAGCKGTECSFTLEVESSVEAAFVPAEPFEVNVVGEGAPECEVVETKSIGPCNAKYPEGTKLEVIGDPESGWRLKEFVGGVGSAKSCSGETICSFTINEPSSVTIMFEPTPKFSLTVNTWGKGTVTSLSPSGISCPGTCTAEFEFGGVELLATPDPGYEFVGWIGCPGSEPECGVLLNKNTEVTAVFLKVAKEGPEGKPGKEGPTGPEGNEGDEGPEGPEGNEGEEGPEGKPGKEGAKGKDGAEGKEGQAGASGLSGAAGPPGDSGVAGPAGAAGPQGPAGVTGATGAAGAPGQIELVTCTIKKKKGKNTRECTTKMVSGTVKFTASASSLHAELSRHGVVYATGAAAFRHGQVRLRLAALRRLPRGRYTLTVGSGRGRHTEKLTLG